MMIARVFHRIFTTARRLLPALALVLSAAAVLPANRAEAQSAVISISPACCTSGVLGQAWSQTFTASGGKAPYSFSVSGSPGWMSAEAHGNTQVILSGVPDAAYSYSLIITATDSDGRTGSITGTLEIAKATPTVTITAVASTHPDGAWMTMFPVTVLVQFNGAAVMPPAGEILVSGGAGDSPSCAAVIDATSRTGECDLVYDAAGTYSISASYPGDANYNSSATAGYSGIPLSIAAFSVHPMLTAGRTHTCFLQSAGTFSCWGADESYLVDGSGYSVTGGPVLALSGGGYHTCFIKADSSVECWGDNPAIKDYPNQSGRRFTRLSSGNDFACAIDTRGKAHCWGTLPAGLPAEPSGQYQAISAGADHACALKKSDASIECWGVNTWQQTNHPTSLTGVKAIAAGNTHTCAVKSTNDLACWGTFSGAVPAGTNFTQVAAGSDYSCAMNTSGRLACWGNGLAGVDTLSAFNGFASGFLHTCAWSSHSPKDYLSCWGANTYGQAPRLSLSPVINGAYVNYIPLGATWTQSYNYGGGAPPYTLALQSATLPPGALSGGTVTWQPAALGSPTFSLTLSESASASRLPLELAPLTLSTQLVVQDPSTTLTASIPASSVQAGSPVLVSVQVAKTGTPPLSGTVTITGGDSAHTNTCQSQVSNAGGTAACTLYFAFSGPMKIHAAYSGNSFYQPSALPVDLDLAVEAVTITPLVSAGSRFSCSLDTSGLPSCWGKNDIGQASPTSYVYTQLSASDGFTCGRGLDAQLFCWGWDGFGLNTPPAGMVFSAVAAGSTHACGLKTDESVTCWGYSGGGRTSGPPAGVAYSAVTAGDDHACALRKADGKASCWGLNTYGQSSPPDSTSFKQISAGGTFTCGITASDGLACWGGTGVNDAIRNAPVSGVYLSIDAGYAHACAVRSDHRVVCWGDSSGGRTSAPDRAFQSVSAGRDHTCGIRQKISGDENDYIECWGSNALGQAPSITITPAALATIDVGVEASLPVTAQGGRSGQFTYTVVGSLPDGLQIDSTTGLVHGSPTAAGEYDFTIRAIENGWAPAMVSERAYHLVIRARVAVTITAITPAERMAGRPVTFQVQVSETPGGRYATPPTGMVSVTVSDGRSCQAGLSAAAGQSTGSCSIFFTSSGVKSVSAAYPGDAHFIPGSTAASQQITPVPFVQPETIRTGLDRTYLHHADGSLACAGANCALGGLTGLLSAVDIGESLACGLGLDGLVRCRDAITPPAAAQAVLANGPYTGIAVGQSHACALRLDGTLFCWGDNASGQAAPPGGVFVRIYAGGDQTCGIRDGGQLECWGSGGTPPAGLYASASLGQGHACGLRLDGTIACWGDNSSGQSDPPTTGVFQAVSAGGAHSCALDEAGGVTCWGADDAGQAGEPYGTFTALASAGDHSCALRPGLKLTCWGGNASGEAPQIQVSALLASEIQAGQYWEFAFNPAGGTRPYQGSVSAGQLPLGLDLSVTLSPAGVILYGTPQVPDDYHFVLNWEDEPSPARPIPLVLEQPYDLRVTGADLAVSVRSSGAIAMAQNPFRFFYTFQVLTILPVPSSRVIVQLPEGLSDVTFSGLGGCVLSGLELTCDPALISPGLGQTLVVEGKVTAGVGLSLNTAVEIQPSTTGWPELVPGNNAASLSVPVAYQALVFEDGFDAPPGDAWNSGTAILSPGGTSYLGDFTSGSALRLLLDGLAPHRQVDVSFDLYVIGPWRGNNAGDPAGPSAWQFGETGLPPLRLTTFCNAAGGWQAYPGDYPGGVFPARTGAAGSDTLGFTGIADTRYHLAFSFDHSADALDLTLLADGLPPGAAWGLDNVRVTIGSGIKLLYLPLLMR